jgi:hypothetical protein
MNTNKIFSDVLSCLERYLNGSMPLHQLSAELKVLQDDIEGMPNSWVIEFDKLRSALEEVNAIRLDEDYTGSNEHDDFVRQTVEKLKSLVSDE